MNKKIIFAVSSENKKYYFSEITEKLPLSIREEIKILGTCLAEKTNGIFKMGFYEDGSISLELTSSKDKFCFDEICAKMEIENLRKEKKELISSLIIWYKLILKNIL